MIPGLIPDLNALERAAETVLRSIPPALVRGEIVTGLYGMGFLGRWALPRLKAQGVRMESCHDGNAALRGRCIDGVPVVTPANSRPGARSSWSSPHDTR